MTAPATDLSIAEVRGLRPGALTQAGYAARAGGRDLQGAAADTDDALAQHGAAWRGPAAAAARHRVQRTLDAARSVVAQSSHLADTLDGVAARIATARDRVLTAVEETALAGFAVDEQAGTATPLEPTDATRREAREATARLRRLLRDLSAVDADAATAVREAMRRETTRWPTGLSALARPFLTLDGVPAPPHAAAPGKNRRYWDSLTGAQRDSLIRTIPATVGAMDGAPADARHRANMLLLDQEEARLHRRAEQLQNRYAQSFSSRIGGLFTDTDEELAAVRSTLEDVDAIRTVTAEHPSARLLSLDLRSGDHARAAVALGDPDTARHIAVSVPGDNSSVRNSLAGMVRESAALRSEAAAQAVSGGGPADEDRGRVSTIAWIGYEPPQVPGLSLSLDLVSEAALHRQRLFEELEATATDDIAREGADQLAPFLAGLDAASDLIDPHITVLGHSYGSLTASLALQHPAAAGAVDDAVFYGSPGLEADSPSDLGLAPHHAYVIEASGDPIADAGLTHFFGPDPSRVDGFEQLSADPATAPDGRELAGSEGHSQYTSPGPDGSLRTSEYNIAAVVSGAGQVIPR